MVNHDLLEGVVICGLIEFNMAEEGLAVGCFYLSDFIDG
jgi:hypothetical protein